MKLFISGLILAAGFWASQETTQAQGSGYSSTVLGSQFIEIAPNQTNVIVPQFLCPGAGLLTQSGITSNTVFGVTEAVTNGAVAYLSFANDYAAGGAFLVSGATANGGSETLQLIGKPPLNGGGAPLTNGQYEYNGSNQPTTYFALVTAGALKGNFFTVLSNTAATLMIAPKGLTIPPHAILAINVLPYWTLAGLFPSGMTNISFIATTNPSNVMSQIIISPPYTIDSQQPQQAGSAYYFSASLTNWVSETNPGVAAGDAIVAPGAYVYFINTGSNTYPLDEFISGKILTSPFNLYFTSSSTNTVVTYFGLPRNSSYKLSEIGFNNKNFTPSVTKTLLGRNDVLILDDGHGGVGASYYSYKNQWYDSSSDALPTDPIFPPGSVFGLLKQANRNATNLLVNNSNEQLIHGLPSASIFTADGPVPFPAPGVTVNPTNNSGGD
jgi:uncharacterized protein (TIGR02597 family)